MSDGGTTNTQQFDISELPIDALLDAAETAQHGGPVPQNFVQNLTVADELTYIYCSKTGRKIGKRVPEEFELMQAVFGENWQARYMHFFRERRSTEKLAAISLAWIFRGPEDLRQLVTQDAVGFFAWTLGRLCAESKNPEPSPARFGRSLVATFRFAERCQRATLLELNGILADTLVVLSPKLLDLPSALPHELCSDNGLAYLRTTLKAQVRNAMERALKAKRRKDMATYMDGLGGDKNLRKARSLAARRPEELEWLESLQGMGFDFITASLGSVSRNSASRVEAAKVPVYSGINVATKPGQPVALNFASKAKPVEASGGLFATTPGTAPSGFRFHFAKKG